MQVEKVCSHYLCKKKNENTECVRIKRKEHLSIDKQSSYQNIKVRGIPDKKSKKFFSSRIQMQPKFQKIESIRNVNIKEITKNQIEDLQHDYQEQIREMRQSILNTKKERINQKSQFITMESSLINSQSKRKKRDAMEILYSMVLMIKKFHSRKLIFFMKRFGIKKRKNQSIRDINLNFGSSQKIAVYQYDLKDQRSKSPNIVYYEPQIGQSGEGEIQIFQETKMLGRENQVMDSLFKRDNQNRGQSNQKVVKVVKQGQSGKYKKRGSQSRIEEYLEKKKMEEKMTERRRKTNEKRMSWRSQFKRNQRPMMNQALEIEDERQRGIGVQEYIIESQKIFIDGQLVENEREELLFDVPKKLEENHYEEMKVVDQEFNKVLNMDDSEGLSGSGDSFLDETQDVLDNKKDNNIYGVSLRGQRQINLGKITNVKISQNFRNQNNIKKNSQQNQEYELVEEYEILNKPQDSLLSQQKWYQGDNSNITVKKSQNQKISQGEWKSIIHPDSNIQSTQTTYMISKHVKEKKQPLKQKQTVVKEEWQSIVRPTQEVKIIKETKLLQKTPKDYKKVSKKYKKNQTRQIVLDSSVESKSPIRRVNRKGQKWSKTVKKEIVFDDSEKSQSVSIVERKSQGKVQKRKGEIKTIKMVRDSKISKSLHRKKSKKKPETKRLNKSQKRKKNQNWTSIQSTVLLPGKTSKTTKISKTQVIEFGDEVDREIGKQVRNSKREINQLSLKKKINEHVIEFEDEDDEVSPDRNITTLKSYITKEVFREQKSERNKEIVVNDIRISQKQLSRSYIDFNKPDQPSKKMKQAILFDTVPVAIKNYPDLPMKILNLKYERKQIKFTPVIDFDKKLCKLSQMNLVNEYLYKKDLIDDYQRPLVLNFDRKSRNLTESVLVDSQNKILKNLIINLYDFNNRQNDQSDQPIPNILMNYSFTDKSITQGLRNDYPTRQRNITLFPNKVRIPKTDQRDDGSLPLLLTVNLKNQQITPSNDPDNKLKLLQTFNLFRLNSRPQKSQDNQPLTSFKFTFSKYNIKKEKTQKINPNQRAKLIGNFEIQKIKKPAKSQNDEEINMFEIDQFNIAPRVVKNRTSFIIKDQLRDQLGNSLEVKGIQQPVKSINDSKLEKIILSKDSLMNFLILKNFTQKIEKSKNEKNTLPFTLDNIKKQKIKKSQDQPLLNGFKIEILKFLKSIPVKTRTSLLRKDFEVDFEQNFELPETLKEIKRHQDDKIDSPFMILQKIRDMKMNGKTKIIDKGLNEENITNTLQVKTIKVYQNEEDSPDEKFGLSHLVKISGIKLRKETNQLQEDYQSDKILNDLIINKVNTLKKSIDNEKDNGFGLEIVKKLQNYSIQVGTIKVLNEINDPKLSNEIEVESIQSLKKNQDDQPIAQYSLEYLQQVRNMKIQTKTNKSMISKVPQEINKNLKIDFLPRPKLSAEDSLDQKFKLSTLTVIKNQKLSIQTSLIDQDEKQENIKNFKIEKISQKPLKSQEGIRCMKYAINLIESIRQLKLQNYTEEQENDKIQENLQNFTIDQPQKINKNLDDLNDDLFHLDLITSIRNRKMSKLTSVAFVSRLINPLKVLEISNERVEYKKSSDDQIDGKFKIEVLNQIQNLKIDNSTQNLNKDLLSNEIIPQKLINPIQISKNQDDSPSGYFGLSLITSIKSQKIDKITQLQSLQRVEEPVKGIFEISQIKVNKSQDDQVVGKFGLEVKKKINSRKITKRTSKLNLSLVRYQLEKMPVVKGMGQIQRNQDDQPINKFEISIINQLRDQKISKLTHVNELVEIEKTLENQKGISNLKVTQSQDDQPINNFLIETFQRIRSMKIETKTMSSRIELPKSAEYKPMIKIQNIEKYKLNKDDKIINRFQIETLIDLKNVKIKQRTSNLIRMPLKQSLDYFKKPKKINSYKKSTDDQPISNFSIETLIIGKMKVKSDNRRLMRSSEGGEVKQFMVRDNLPEILLFNRDDQVDESFGLMIESLHRRQVQKKVRMKLVMRGDYDLNQKFLQTKKNSIIDPFRITNEYSRIRENQNIEVKEQRIERRVEKVPAVRKVRRLIYRIMGGDYKYRNLLQTQPNQLDTFEIQNNFQRQTLPETLISLKVPQETKQTVDYSLIPKKKKYKLIYRGYKPQMNLIQTSPNSLRKFTINSPQEIKNIQPYITPSNQPIPIAKLPKKKRIMVSIKEFPQQIPQSKIQTKPNNLQNFNTNQVEVKNTRRQTAFTLRKKRTLTNQLQEPYVRELVMESEIAKPKRRRILYLLREYFDQIPNPLIQTKFNNLPPFSINPRPQFTQQIPQQKVPDKSHVMISKMPYVKRPRRKKYMIRYLEFDTIPLCKIQTRFNNLGKFQISQRPLKLDPYQSVHTRPIMPNQSVNMVSMMPNQSVNMVSMMPNQSVNPRKKRRKKFIMRQQQFYQIPLRYIKTSWNNMEQFSITQQRLKEMSNPIRSQIPSRMMGKSQNVLNSQQINQNYVINQMNPNQNSQFTINNQRKQNLDSFSTLKSKDVHVPSSSTQYFGSNRFNTIESNFTMKESQRSQQYPQGVQNIHQSNQNKNRSPSFLYKYQQSLKNSNKNGVDQSEQVKNRQKSIYAVQSYQQINTDQQRQSLFKIEIPQGMDVPQESQQIQFKKIFKKDEDGKREEVIEINGDYKWQQSSGINQSLKMDQGVQQSGIIDVKRVSISQNPQFQDKQWQEYQMKYSQEIMNKLNGAMNQKTFTKRQSSLMINDILQNKVSNEFLLYCFSLSQTQNQKIRYIQSYWRYKVKQRKKRRMKLK